MKKAGSLALIAVTGLLCAFTLGLYLGGGTGDAPVTVLPLAAIQAAPHETAETSLPALSGPPPTVTAVPTHDSEETHIPTDPAGEVSGPVNINTATVEELKALPGIGDVLAQRIVDYREAHGDFSSIEELMQVSGIGDKRFAAIRDLVTVGG